MDYTNEHLRPEKGAKRFVTDPLVICKNIQYNERCGIFTI